MLTDFDFWKFLAGLGVFVYGMFLLEEGISKISGKNLQRFIKRATGNKFKSILTGTFATGIVQSSSAISLLVLAFVGAGIIEGANAIAVIIGSNLGTTFTSWIVAFFGFKIKIESYALPLIAIGGILYLAGGKSTKLRYISYIITGFGLLFLGLNYMKESVDTFTENFDLTKIPHFGLLFYVLLGIILTAIIQSSSATVAIVLTSVYSGILGSYEAFGIIIGSNIGTTITVFLGAIGGTVNKKRVAYSHLIFNVVTAIFAIFLIKPSLYLINEILNMRSNPVMAIALYHTVFNLFGILLFYPFIHKLASILTKLVKEKEFLQIRFIDKVSPKVFEVSLEALKKEIIHLFCYAIVQNLLRLNMRVPWDDMPQEYEIDRNANDAASIYINLKNLNNEIINYSLEMRKEEQKKQEIVRLDKYLHAARDILNAAKNVQDLERNIEWLDNVENEFIEQQFKLLKERIDQFYLSFITFIRSDRCNPEAIKEVYLNIEKFDAVFVNDSLSAIQNSQISKKQVTDLMMTNRIILQSCGLLNEALEELYGNRNNRT